MKNKIAIITDTASDLSVEYCQENGIYLVPFTIYIKTNGQQVEYKDTYEITPNDFYAMMKSGSTVQTATATMGDIIAIYRQAEEDGYTEVIAIVTSSGLSGMCQNFTIAKEMYEGPLKIHVFDSKTLSYIEGMLVKKAFELAQMQVTAAEIIVELEQLYSGSKAMFVPATLEYLIRGGRLGGISAIIGSCLNIIPIAYVNEEGKFGGLEKKRGFKNAVKRMAEIICENAVVGRDIIYVMSGGSSEVYDSFQSKIKELAPDVEIRQGEIGAAVAAHAGPGVIACALIPWHKIK
ncbi:MAG: DegV family protein [Culicoidibacterales bacterium]